MGIFGRENFVCISDNKRQILIIDKLTIEAISKDSFQPGISSSNVKTDQQGLVITLMFFHQVKAETKIEISLETKNSGKINILAEFDGQEWQLVENEEQT